ncbi:Cof-type HAD-IIB family hydrolase [Xylanimonas protaetiae]|uniref:HAD family hydrolase n=1 Tax=Xylanimonas protaetiae TaxID=2509457 RepID=A0A4P6F2Q6_9MICO|nr:Cof-type HAD-IIB family hydrolase [Xylanimonas protaetiae]QAY69455.1 HAD family hydrolase [Xylanimonas protaetiae]
MSPSPAPSPVDPAVLDDAAPDVRLVVADMDGTLLDSHGRVPAGFWPLLDLMRERGIAFAPASGRQYATLARTFAGHLDGMCVIAENGTFVVRDGVELSAAPLSPQAAADVVRRVRDVVAAGRDAGIVVCGKRTAYVDRTDDAFWTEAARYYTALEAVPDLAPVASLEAVDDEILKVAVFDFDDVGPAVAPALAPLRATEQVVVSGRNWVDVMAAGVTKGAAVERLQAELGVTREQTVAFGDYLNDVEMLDAAAWSFAMADAHPQVLARARHVAPPAAEHGVVQVLERLLAH